MAKAPLSCMLSFITLTLLLKSSVIAAQNSSNISIGQTLTAATNGSAWISPGANFVFGFHPFNGRSDLFLLAIWYANIPDTIVWHANEGNPVPQGSKVTLDAGQGLVLNDPQGAHLWDTFDDLTGPPVVSYGFMNDTGNFALKSGSGDAVWESFGHPTDTLLPAQILDIGFEVNSRLSDTSFTKGRFQLRLIPDGNLVLNTRDMVTGFAYGAYYVSTTNENSATAGQKLIYKESGYMYILRKNGSMYDLLPQIKMAPSEKDYYQRATLNFDGVLSWYSIPKNSTDNRWSMIQSIPENICMIIVDPTPDLGSGICGFNSICSLGVDQRPTCTCPKSYSPLDTNDTYISCKPDFKLEGCEGYAEHAEKGEHQMVHLPNTDSPFNDYERLDPSTENDCKNSCLNDCFCAAAMFRPPGTLSGCWKKKGPLSNGRHDRRVEGTFWIKVGNVNYSGDPVNPFIPPPKKDRLKIVVSVLLGGSVLVNLFLLGTICLGNFLLFHKKPFKVPDEGQSKTLREYSNVHCFSYKELEEATGGFREELGRGAFGIVYKGMIKAEGSSKLIAVKKLDRLSKDADKEFNTEVNVIGQTHHKNLVRLIGFCKEKDQRLLVYEYMSNGTLADYLFGDLRPSWMARVQVVLGIARGLSYLHEECMTQIIHCDIKPQNILVDDYHNARISDFGLAKLLVLNQSQTNTAIRGTKGYVAPEWFRNKPVTVKVDVYSFGVLLLEIICCRKSVCLEIIEEERAILTDWAFDCYQSSALDSLVNDDMEALSDKLRLERFVMVALWCIQEDPSFRPRMRLVTQMLEGLAEVPSPPCPNSFTITTSQC